MCRCVEVIKRLMNISSIVWEHKILSTVAASLLFMWLMPFGSFDPTTFGFYCSVALAVFIASFNRFSHLYEMESDVLRGKLRFLRRVNRVLWIIIGSILCMWIMPYGSFDPTELRFYFCIANAVIIDALIRLSKGNSHNYGVPMACSLA